MTQTERSARQGKVACRQGKAASRSRHKRPTQTLSSCALSQSGFMLRCGFARSAREQPVLHGDRSRPRRPGSSRLLSCGSPDIAGMAQLRGHGGPVRALTISADGKTLLSGSFDGSAIRWSLERDAAEQVLRFHDDAVNATALFKDGRAATAGADGRIAIWSPGKAAARSRARRPQRAGRSDCALKRRHDAGVGIVGSRRAAVAGGRRRAARAFKAIRKTSTASPSPRTDARW